MESIQKILAGDKPVLIDFFATWCGPCKMMTPVVEELSKELGGSMHVLKIDVDQHEELSEQYRIQSVPTFLLLDKGEIMWRKSGVISKNILFEEAQKLIKK